MIDCHRRAVDQISTRVDVIRKKRTDKFNYCTVEFDYDADDYFYIPGLYRPFDPGFLQPVFFQKSVLIKFENLPSYNVKFASTTYGTIEYKDDYISFGLNKNDKLVMWLGDIAKLPENEQYYLRSENIPSDHDIGSEFYDGQIECKFTDRSAEDELFRARSSFIEACNDRFGLKVGHLDDEVLELALALNPPIIDTLKERRHVADALNKIYLESLDNKNLAKIMTLLGAVPAPKLGSIKRLEAIAKAVNGCGNIDEVMLPFYVLYDLRVAYSHLTSSSKSEKVIKTVEARLGLETSTAFAELYRELIERLTVSFSKLTVLCATPPK